MTKPINEISKKLAGSYVQSVAGSEARRGEKYSERKAQITATRNAAAQAGWDRDEKVQDSAQALKNASYDADKKLDRDHSRKTWNRMKGVHSAMKTLTKEDLIPAIVGEDVTSVQEVIDTILRAKIDAALFEGPNDPDDEDEDDDFGGDDNDDDIEEEALDELSIDQLKAYHGAAKADHANTGARLNTKFNRKDWKRINKRREGMSAAIRAAGKKIMGEDVEQVDELSKDKVGKYSNAAKIWKYEKQERWNDSDNDKEKDDIVKGFKRRNRGLDNAEKRLKEDEQIDELSKETLGSYATSRLLQRWRTNPKDKKAVKKAEKAEPYMKKAWAKAYSKNEEVEQVDELSTNTLNNYVVKAAKDQYRQSNMHNIASKSRFKTKRADQLVQDTEYGESDREFRDRQDRVTRRRANLAKTMSDTTRKWDNRRKGTFLAGKKLIKKEMGQ